MRLAPTFLLISLISFFIPAVATTAPHYLNRRASRTIAARQHRHKRGLLDDICADLDLSTLLLGLDLNLKLCLCLSTLPLALETTLALKVLGLDLLTGLILESGHHCSYPAHSHAICTPKNPCDFECTDGHVKHNGLCVCPLPRVVCRGKCASSCASSIPTVHNLQQSNPGPAKVVTRAQQAKHSLLESRDLVPSADSSFDLYGATKELIKYTVRLCEDLLTISASPDDDSTTIYIKSVTALSAQSLISSIVVSVNNSTTTGDLVPYLYTVLRADDLLATSLKALGGYGSLWQDTKDILQATLNLLYLCDPHAHPPVHPSTSLPIPSHPSTSLFASHPQPTSNPPNASPNPPIFIDLTPLLHDLALGGSSYIGLDLDGLLGTKGLNGLTNGLLAGLGLGGNPPGAPTGIPSNPPPQSGNTLLGIDLVALVSSLTNLNATSCSDTDLLLGLGSATDYSDLVKAVGDINNALLRETWQLTDYSLKATVLALEDTNKLLHDLEGCGCGGDHEAMSSLLGLKSSLLGNSNELLGI